MMDINTPDPEYPARNGQRTDDRNIINEWLDGKDPDRAKYVWNLEDFNAVNEEETDYLIGTILFFIFYSTVILPLGTRNPKACLLELIK